MKKVVATLGAGALLLTLAVPAFAKSKCWCVGRWCRACRDRNRIHVRNDAWSEADTGNNHQDNAARVDDSCGGSSRAGSRGKRDIYTRDAYSDASAEVDIIRPRRGCVGPCGRVRRPVTNRVWVENTATSYANTGGNTQNNSASVRFGGRASAAAGSRGDREIDTGDAQSSADAWVVIGPHFVR